MEQKPGRLFFISVVFWIAWVVSGCSPAPEEQSARSVAEAWEARHAIDGKQVTLRGYFGKLEVATTVQLCDPPRCDCNSSSASRVGLFDPDTIEAVRASQEYPKKMVLLDLFQCKGDQCAVQCSPIDPTNPNEMEVSGTFSIINADTPYPYLLMTVSNLEDVRQKVNGAWEPVPTGTYEVSLPQK